jgi:outer membrane receptor for ferrienterochelin and colicins
MRIKTIILVLSAYSIFNLTLAFSGEDSKSKAKTEGIIEELRWLQAESIITIATRHATSISRAPGIATVITAKQIKQMGFRTLTDILKTIPGFDVSMDNLGVRQIAVRGFILPGNSERVRVLIDGHPVNDPYWGGAMHNFYDLAVENIKRIEVIRGPGSALYGKNAFVGVVNVVTKDTEDIDGFQWTGSGGSYDTQNYNMLFAKEYGDLKISGFFDYLDTEGFSRRVERDKEFPDPWSMSPGRSQNEKEKTDLNLKLSYKNLEIKGKYMKKRKEGYIGVDDSLTDENDLKDTYVFAELIYNGLALGEKLRMIPRVYYDLYYQDHFFEALPDGTTSGGAVYPDGFQGRVGFIQTTLGFEDQFNYDVFDGNRLTFGFQYEWIHQNDVRSSKYTFDPSLPPPFTFAPLSPPMSFSDTFPFTKDKKTRQIWSLYLQDEWNITENIDLTVGVRHDNFTRFGGTTNPRFGLVWRFIEDAHLKFLFGTAFRAPNFREMFLQNQSIIVGNSSLDPEKINTYEFEMGYNFTKHISGSMNFFFNRIRDIIVLVPQAGTVKQKYQNRGGARIKGVEAEIRADFGDNNYAYANYTYQDAEETSDRNRLAEVPIHKANLGVNVAFSKYVNAHLHTFITGPRPREDGDTRRDLPSHTQVNLTLIGKNFMDNFEIRGSAFNLFGQGYDDPSDSEGVPTDYPQPRNSFMVELRYVF